MNFMCFSIPSVVHSTKTNSFLLEQSSIEKGSKKKAIVDLFQLKVYLSTFCTGY